MSLTLMEPPAVEPEPYRHEPVMKAEALRFLINDPDGLYVDATVGLGGHAAAILSRLSAQSKLLGLDKDPDALHLASERLKDFRERFVPVLADFRTLGHVLKERRFFPLSGALFDLGASSMQLENPDRGFSFMRDGPLDMRFSPNAPLDAAAIVNRWPREQIAFVLSEYGEEPAADRIAAAIARRREKKPFETTAELSSLIASVVPRRGIHPATRSFMALRIAVNGELDAVAPALESAAEMMKEGGRIVVITFHSLEDRIVKRLFESLESKKLCRFLDEKLVKPSSDEVAGNARSRSAKLRAMERTNEK